MSTNRPNHDQIPTNPFTSLTLVATLYSLSPNTGSENGNTSRSRVDCPRCGRDTAVYPSGLLYRHDPASGRTPELRSCPGSLKTVREPEGELLLFVSAEPATTVDLDEVPAKPGRLF